jgi:streptogramin lyase
MQTVRELKGQDRFLISAIALVMLTCAMPSRAWSASTSLWVAYSQGGGIESYSTKQLKKSGMPTPIEISTYEDATGVAFDASGNLWAVVNQNDIVEFTAAQLKDLKSDPSPTPVVIITTTAGAQGLFGCAFDPKGNLWVADADGDMILELSKAQLAAGSATGVTPTGFIHTIDFAFPAFITFDQDGNAWVVSQGTSRLVELTASQLTSGGTKTPAVVLTDDGSGSIDLPGEIAFDKKGDLWVPNFSSDTVVEFAKDQLASSGNPTPAVTLNSAVFDEPFGAVFDSKGDLVIMNYHNAKIAKFTDKQIKKSGSPAPKATVTGTGTINYQIIFGPAS